MVTPILVAAFRRPQHLEKVINALNSLSNPIFFWFDGPRPDTNDSEKIAESISLIHASKIPNFEIIQNPINIGTGSVAHGVTWILERFSEVIIIEEDVVPSPEFIQFAENMLVKFRDDLGIGSINGTNFVPSEYLTYPNNSYRFSSYFYAWGWATWNNRWSQIDTNFEKWDYSKLHWPPSARNIFSKSRWLVSMDAVRTGSAPGLWDYLWLYTYWKNGWLSVVPNKNLVTNIGFDQEATHTKRVPEWQYPESGRITYSIQTNDQEIRQDLKADKWAARNIHNSSPDIIVKTWLRKKLRSII